MRPLAWVILGLSVGTLFQGRAAKGDEGFAVVQTVRSNQLHLFAPVSVNRSKVMWFLVDTGSPKSLISGAARKSLSLPSPNAEQTVHLRGVPNALPTVYAQSIRAMDMELGPGYLVQAPIAFGAERTWQARVTFNKEGLIGMDFLVKHGAVINCRTQQIFFSRTASKLPLPREGYEKMGFTYVPIRITREGYPEVDGSIDGLEYTFLLDTGAFWTTLDPEVQQRNHLPIVRRGTGTLPYNGQGRLPIMFAHLPELRIGDHEVRNEVLCFAMIRPPSGTVHKWGGLIGADLLFKRRAIIDLGNRGLYLMADKKK